MGRFTASLFPHEQLRKNSLCGKERGFGGMWFSSLAGQTVFVYSKESAEKDFYYEKDCSARR